MNKLLILFQVNDILKFIFKITNLSQQHSSFLCEVIYVPHSTRFSNFIIILFIFSERYIFLNISL